MPPSPGTPLVAALRQLTASLDDRPDEDLVALFATGRDVAAFATIVRRHGALVFDVCRSVLRNQADAEDAFQTTFLALATKSHTIRTAASLAAWLQGTAWRMARKAMRARDRRRAHEARTPARPHASPPDPSWAEVREALHEEVNRLPERYRAAVVLFNLAGHTQD
jgi:RNA polymerase sigma factor (sigma-70 family)